MRGLGGGGLKILGLEGGSVPHYMPCVFFFFFFFSKKIFRFNKIHKKGIEKSLKKSKTTQDLALIGHHRAPLRNWNFDTLGQEFYDKIRHKFITKCQFFITKCSVYYEMRRYNIVNFFFDITYLNYSELKIVAIQTAFVLKGLGWTYISQYLFLWQIIWNPIGDKNIFVDI